MLDELFAKRTDLAKLRSQAWERAKALGLPKGVRGTYVAATPPALPAGVEALPLAQAALTYGAFLNSRWSRSLKEETSAHAALNGAVHGEGLFFYIPPGTKVEAPIHLNHHLAPDTLTLPRVHLFIGAGAQVELIEKVSGEGQCNGLFDIALEDGVRATLTLLHDGHIHSSIRATLKRNAHLKTFAYTESGSLTHDYRVALAGENGEVDLTGGWHLRDDHRINNNIHVEHIAPHCRSSQLFKGVLHDTSRSSFIGKIYVHREAQKTDAFQLNNNLILSDRASAHSEPNLEIFADDVKASHGSTTGQFDPAELFYLRTRGLTESAAKSLLVDAFLKQVMVSQLERFPDHGL